MVEPAIVKLLIQYLYEADYQPPLLAEGASHARFDGENNMSASTANILDHAAGKLCKHYYCEYHCKCKCTSFDFGSAPSPAINCETGHFLIHSKMFQLADMYDIPGLKKISTGKFREACSIAWDRPDFPEAIAHVYESTTEDQISLRGIVCNTISKHTILLENPRIRDLMTEINALVFGVLMKHTRRP